jgi:hypothetical protein
MDGRPRSFATGTESGLQTGSSAHKAGDLRRQIHLASASAESSAEAVHVGHAVLDAALVSTAIDAVCVAHRFSQAIPSLSRSDLEFAL